MEVVFSPGSSSVTARPGLAWDSNQWTVDGESLTRSVTSDTTVSRRLLTSLGGAGSPHRSDDPETVIHTRCRGSLRTRLTDTLSTRPNRWSP
jgi:hypothetical protein